MPDMAGKLEKHRSTDFGMESQKIPGDGVITGGRTVNGRTMYLSSKDFVAFCGSLSEARQSVALKPSSSRRR